MTHFPRRRYLLSQRAYEHRVLEEAAEILEQRYVRGEAFTRTQNTADYLRCKLATSMRSLPFYCWITNIG
ncbi:hypothetical protein VCSRO5_2022 [Vibrio cholerae]|nr:dNA repair RadC family protein [Vibrio cholerae]BCK18105.1 hypothetical protein VCSRO5_2022 [Vibrio cholerae]GHW12863.1 dNA repair RadC family protein [Vibrio cholerae]GHY86160.1 dNA repair RadC family protein [Vibrio cholerae]GHY95779.1 dNA repair RadC family protein [Vibrio cholerae]